MVIESALTRGAYVKILLQLALRSLWTYVIGGAILLVVLGVAFLVFGYPGMLYWTAFFVLVFVGAFVFFLISSTRPGKNANMFLPVRYAFNEQGVRAETSITKEEGAWSAFVMWKKAAGYYLLFANAASFMAIPQSAIPDVPAFETLLRTKIKKK